MGHRRTSEAGSITVRSRLESGPLLRQPIHLLAKLLDDLAEVVRVFFYDPSRRLQVSIGLQIWLWRIFGAAHSIERLSAEPEANRVCRGRTFAV